MPRREETEVNSESGIFRCLYWYFKIRGLICTWQTKVSFSVVLFPTLCAKEIDKSEKIYAANNERTQIPMVFGGCELEGYTSWTRANLKFDYGRVACVCALTSLDNWLRKRFSKRQERSICKASFQGEGLECNFKVIFPRTLPPRRFSTQLYVHWGKLEILYIAH